MSLFDSNFTWIDGGIVAAYLLISIWVGLYANRFVGNLSGYLVAGRTLRIRLALATMTGTEIGLVTVMYVAELGFVQQFASLYLAIYEFVILLAIGATGFVVCKLRETGAMTIPEFYEQRYTRGVRVLGGLVMAIAGILNTSLFLQAGAKFLVAITGYSDPVGVKWIMTGLLALVLFYTVLGGMVSVVITDLVQFIVLGAGMILVTVFVVAEVGFDGFNSAVTEHNAYVNPWVTDNPSTDSPNYDIGPMKLLSQAVVLSVALMLWPTAASRSLAVKTPQVAKQLYFWSAIPFLSRRTIPALWGIGAFVFFTMHGDLLTELQQSEGVSTLQAMPLFLAKIIPTGLLGLVTAGMIAAFMSTHDSYLLCWSGVITQDVVAPLCGGKLTERTRVFITRVSIVVIGLMLLVWGLWYEVASDLWQYMAVTGTVYLAGVLPVVVGGLYWKDSSSTGAYLALSAGILGLLGMDPIVAAFNEFLVPVTSFYLRADHCMLATFALALVGFVAGSLIWPDRKAES